MAFNQQKYIEEFKKQHYDVIKVELPKGYKDKLKALAEQHGLSMAKMVQKLIDEKENKNVTR